jgi:stress response protein YsnF
MGRRAPDFRLGQRNERRLDRLVNQSASEGTGIQRGSMAHPTNDPPRFAGEERLSAADRQPEGGRIERIEERAVIGKRVEDRGGVRVTTRTETGTETIRASLEEVAVEVERVPVGRFVEAAEAPRVEGDVTVLPVYEERLVVERKLFLVEEVHVRRLARVHEVEVPVELQRQVVEVERLPPSDDTPSM